MGNGKNATFYVPECQYKTASSLPSELVFAVKVKALLVVTGSEGKARGL